jgi:hypothetical protein
MLPSQILISYFNLRAAIGLCAMLLPLFTLALNGFVIQSSISAYYHINATRDIFVASLCVIGVFLLTYEGYTDERWVTNIMGLAAIGTGLFPTARDDLSTTWVSVAHYVCAAILFLGMALLALEFFPRNQSVTPLSTPTKRFNGIIYQLCGAVILFALGVLVGCYVTLGEAQIKNSTILFWVEFVSVEAFGVAWFWKSHALFRLLRSLQRV